MAVLEQTPAGVPVLAACRALGASRATLDRRTAPPAPPRPRGPRRAPRRLGDEERARVLAVLDSAAYVDQPPAEVDGALLSAGTYLCSVRTMYRVLAAAGEVRERRAQRRHPPRAVPRLCATAPNQVFTWDITKLAGPVAGIFYYAYVMIDLFRRYVVGWLLAERETVALAERFVADTIGARGVDPTALTIHQDRGAPMTSGSMAQLCATLGVTQSFSRPRVSDDNPFREAQFKTLTYQPDYPGRFDAPSHARSYLGTFFGWHNDDHHHEGLALFTPADVYFGRVAEVAARRQAALDAAFLAHPERFVRGRPVVPLPPREVTINPLTGPTIPSSEPPPEASLRPSPAVPPGDRAQPSSRAAQPASGASEPLTGASPVARSSARRASTSLPVTPP
ncbi:MAG TPA: DDE-type integrase/transposase/recombinase [Polyangiaceae bacterium]|nr:DDE-type integrase/transposase/recombinase [Polyangiaceae bacterium]